MYHDLVSLCRQCRLFKTLLVNRHVSHDSIIIPFVIIYDILASVTLCGDNLTLAFCTYMIYCVGLNRYISSGNSPSVDPS